MGSVYTVYIFTYNLDPEGMAELWLLTGVIFTEGFII